MADHEKSDPQADLLRLAGSVHTYESFGRAVVASALAHAAKSAQLDNATSLTATVSVSPHTHAQPGVDFGAGTHGAGDDAAGGAATGHVPPTCYTLSLGFGDDSPTITVCA